MYFVGEEAIADTDITQVRDKLNYEGNQTSHLKHIKTG